MEKIKITREQEEALERYKKVGGNDEPIKKQLAEFLEREFPYTQIFKPLETFTPEQFALLLCGWYEVEQPFKVGDWVKWVHKDVEEYIKITKITEEGHKFHDGSSIANYKENIEKMEKVTEPWKIMLLELGRERPEFKVGDCCITRSTGTYTYTRRDKGGIAHFEGLFKNDSVKYFYPVESRIEVKNHD